MDPVLQSYLDAYSACQTAAESARMAERKREELAFWDSVAQRDAGRAETAVRFAKAMAAVRSGTI